MAGFAERTLSAQQRWASGSRIRPAKVLGHGVREDESLLAASTVETELPSPLPGGLRGNW